MASINWYPGHMAKSRRMLIEQLRCVDAVIELVDARAPRATANADLRSLLRGKTRLVVLNKADLADDAVTARWVEQMRRRGIEAVRFNANGGHARAIIARIEQATRPAVERAQARGVQKTVRLMVVGIPNVGKSTFINRINGSAIAKASDRPGVTRAKQWVKVGAYLEMLDTPGMLPARLEDQSRARSLAFLGSVRDQILDTQELAGALLLQLMYLKPEQTRARFRLPEGEVDPGAGAEAAGAQLLEAACRGRGWLLSGGRADLQRGAAVVLDEFRAGKVGKISLESPEVAHAQDG